MVPYSYPCCGATGVVERVHGAWIIAHPLVVKERQPIKVYSATFMRAFDCSERRIGEPRCGRYLGDEWVVGKVLDTVGGPRRTAEIKSD